MKTTAVVLMMMSWCCFTLTAQSRKIVPVPLPDETSSSWYRTTSSPNAPQMKLSSSNDLTDNSPPTSPQMFPFQGPFGFTTPALYAPIALASGQVVMFFGRNDSVFSATSSDSGSSWSSVPVFVYKSAFFPVSSSLAAKRTATGRIVLAWATGLNIYRIFSDNGGSSWSTADTVAASTGNGNLTITQTTNGVLWLVYQRFNTTTQSDIFFRTSVDNGAIWGSEQTLLATSSREFSGSIVSGLNSTLVSFHVDNSVNSRSNLYKRFSTNGGGTWSAQTPVLSDTLVKTSAVVLRQSDSTLRMIFAAYSQHFPSPFYVGGFYPNIDLYSSSSTDGGITWSTPARLTRYSGRDIQPKAALFGSEAFVSFGSSRWIGDLFGDRLWCAFTGTAQDNTPPPNALYFTTGSPDVYNLLPIIVQVNDDGTISNVQITYSVNFGIPSQISMFDDGVHGDYAASDGIYGAAVGPVQIGDQVQYTFAVTDNSAQTITMGSFLLTIPGVQNAGNVLLNLGDNSRLGTSGLGNSMTWPKTGGVDYLYLGGLWIGATVSGQNRVMNLHYSETDWRRTPSTPFTLAPGVSSQDGIVTYDDQLAASPAIGLRVIQRSYQWADTTRDDFIILKYTVTNTGLNGNLDSVFVGLWLDPDVPPSFSANSAGYDASRNLMYLSDSSKTGGFFGIKLMGGTSPRTMNFYGPITDNPDAVRYQLLTAGMVPVPSSATDYRTLLTAPAFSLAANQLQSVSFGLVMGNGLTQLRVHADTMEAIWQSRLSTAVEQESSDAIPQVFSLDQNYPNPFNPGTTIKFTLGSSEDVSLKVYDILGREVAVLVKEELSPGSYKANWNAAGFGSGLYFYKIQAGSFSETKKMLLLK